MTKTKILWAVDIRPEAIKMAPLKHALMQFSERYSLKICVMGQHLEMLKLFDGFFDFSFGYDFLIFDLKFRGLSVVVAGQIWINAEDYNFEYVFVNGDNTTMSAAMAAFYGNFMFGLIQAGLRTFHIWSPFAEEMNRNLTNKLANIHFSPTELASKDLSRDWINLENVFVTGNTLIDALHLGHEIIEKRRSAVIDNLKFRYQTVKPIILVTGHKRENYGSEFFNICGPWSYITLNVGVVIVYPVHLNSNIEKPTYELPSDLPDVHLIDPQGYESFIWLMNRSTIIITGNCGIQEEAPILSKPVLVMCETSDKHEAIKTDIVLHDWTVKNNLIECLFSLLFDPELFNRLGFIHNPYWDGLVCNRNMGFLFAELFGDTSEMVLLN